jgi:hypothetical protein
MVRLKHRSRECCELLALLDEQTSVGKPIRVILDPVSSHWSAEVAHWLATHPQRTFVFHFLPVHASWLSFIEVWFSILSRKCLRRADFADASIATEQIEGFMTTYNTHLAHPFEWKKGVRFYKRLKDKIAARSELQLAASGCRVPGCRASAEAVTYAPATLPTLSLSWDKVCRNRQQRNERDRPAHHAPSDPTLMSENRRAGMR